jgi:hypothetical protein
MDRKDRLQEAIKQIDIAIDDANQSDVLRELEDGKESLQEGLELLDEHIK